MKGAQNGGGDGENFGWTRLTPVEPDHLLGDDNYSMFLVHTKTDTEIGALSNNDPVSFFREYIPEIGLGTTRVPVQVLRVNAEIPFNPVRKSAVWLVYPERTDGGADPTAVGVEYKCQS